jgi:hypothetical protein
MENTVTSTDEDERRRLDYSQTTELLRDLADTRFKLVALLPTISGAAVALLSRHPTAGQLLAVGLLGLSATTGVVIYELRNNQLYDYALARATKLEQALAIPSPFNHSRSGGLFGERPGRNLRLFGVTVAHDRGLALTYAAAIGGWTYLLAWGALHALGLPHSQRTGGAVAIAVSLLLLAALLRAGAGPSNQAAAARSTGPNARATPAG